MKVEELAITSFADLEALPLAALKELVHQYPTASIPAMVAARKAHQEKDPDFEHLLTHAALRLPSRSVLKDYVLASFAEETEEQTVEVSEKPEAPVLTDPIPEQVPFEQEAHLDGSTEDESEGSDRASTNAEQAFQEEAVPSENALDNMYAAQAYAANLEAELKEMPADLIEQQLELRNSAKGNDESTPVSEDIILEVNQSDDVKSFTDWLSAFTQEEATSLDETLPEVKEEVVESQQEVQSSPRPSIRREIKEDQLESTKMERVHEMAKKSISKDKSFYTETLAKIYWDQKKWKQAIDVYEVLSLKYPEKSTYFAAQIDLLKENLK
ncbi:MAG: hypothetical protein KTR13_10110 [Saprospiraceae bacterium]|nr:hypothetical protein [Saprospiraceae bacterium]